MFLLVRATRCTSQHTSITHVEEEHPEPTGVDQEEKQAQIEMTSVPTTPQVKTKGNGGQDDASRRTKKRKKRKNEIKRTQSERRKTT